MKANSMMKYFADGKATTKSTTISAHTVCDQPDHYYSRYFLEVSGKYVAVSSGEKWEGNII